MAESDQGETTVSKEDTKTEQSDPYTDVLAQITNPEGVQKYSTTLAALESIKPKDDMIIKLQEENAEFKLKNLEMEEELTKRTSTEELVNKVMENRNKPNAATPAEEDAGKKIDIGELVRQELAGITAENSKISNREKVASALAETFGDKANEVLASKMTELNVSAEFFKNVIESSPVAALELLGVKPKNKAAPVKPHGSVRAESFSEPAPAEHVSVMAKDTKEVKVAWDKLMAEALAS